MADGGVESLKILTVRPYDVDENGITIVPSKSDYTKKEEQVWKLGKTPETDTERKKAKQYNLVDILLNITLTSDFMQQQKNFLSQHL